MGTAAAITALDSPASSGKRVRIWLDGEPFRTTNRRVTKALELTVGTLVRPEELLAQIEDEERRQAKDHALRYLTYRPRSSGELSRRLRTVGYGESAVADTVAWLGAVGYLDDADFAEQWAAERASAKHYGRLRIAAELAQKGFKPAEVADVLDRHCPEEGERVRALAVGRKRLAGARGLDRLAALRRLGPYLRRRGYGASVVASVLDELGLTDEGVEDDLQPRCERRTTG